MAEPIHLDEHHRLEYRSTPWDSRAFGFLTNEITLIEYRDRALLRQMLEQYDAKMKHERVRFVYCRTDAQDFVLRNQLQEHGFYYVETSAVVAKQDVHKEDFRRLFRNQLALREPQSEQDFMQIRAIAESAFNYSRFHEDPNVPVEKARLRYASWIDDLRAQRREFLVHAADGEIQSFIAYTRTKTSVEMILGGSAVGKGFVSPYFWSSFLTHFQQGGVRRVRGVISMANVSIANMYIQLNFRIEKILLGFHRFG